MLTGLTEVIISQYIKIAHHRVAYLKVILKQRRGGKAKLGCPATRGHSGKVAIPKPEESPLGTACAGTLILIFSLQN